MSEQAELKQHKSNACIRSFRETISWQKMHNPRNQQHKNTNKDRWTEWKRPILFRVVCHSKWLDVLFSAKQWKKETDFAFISPVQTVYCHFVLLRPKSRKNLKQRQSTQNHLTALLRRIWNLQRNFSTKLHEGHQNHQQTATQFAIQVPATCKNMIQCRAFILVAVMWVTFSSTSSSKYSFTFRVAIMSITKIQWEQTNSTKCQKETAKWKLQVFVPGNRAALFPMFLMTSFRFCQGIFCKHVANKTKTAPVPFSQIRNILWCSIGVSRVPCSWRSCAHCETWRRFLHLLFAAF